VFHCNYAHICLIFHTNYKHLKGIDYLLYGAKHADMYIGGIDECTNECMNESMNE